MSAPRLALSLALLAALAAVDGRSRLLPSASAQDRKGGGKKEDPPKKGGDKEKDKDKGKEGGKKEDEKKRLSEGDEVKDLTLDLAAGGTWSASSARGKAVVLVFAAEFSTESLDALKTLGDEKGRTAKSGATVLGILRDADAEKARKIAKDRGITVTLALDPKRKAYDRLAKAGLPYTVVLDREGKIVLSTSGFDDESVAKKVADLSKK